MSIFRGRIANRNWLALLFLLIVDLMGATGFSQTVKPVQINRSIEVTSQTMLKVESSLPVTVKLTGTSKKTLSVSLNLQGEALSADLTLTPLAAGKADAKAQMIKITIEGKTPSAYVASGQLILTVPDSLLSAFSLSEGQIAFSKATLNTTVKLGKGDLKLSGLQGNISALVTQGSISCDNSDLKATLNVRSGMLTLGSCIGQIYAQGPGSSVSIQTWLDKTKQAMQTSQLKLLIRKGSMDLKAGQEDILAQISDGVFNFEWKADKKTTGRKLDFQAINSQLNLNLPDGFSMDLNLDQSQSSAFLLASADTAAVPGKQTLLTRGKGKKSKIVSEFAFSIPKEKEVVHQGKKIKVIQGRQLLDGGGNKVSIHSTDSQVNFIKSKTGK